MPTFRPATEADLPAIIALLADDALGTTREKPGHPPHPAYLAAWDAIAADPNQLLAVAEEEGTVIGCLQLSFIPHIVRLGGWRAQIEGVRIATAHRGTGLGTQFFHWAIAQAKQRGCVLVQLTTDKSRPDAHRFYEALGFKASHEGMKLSLT